MLQALSRWKSTILAVSAVLVFGLFLSRHIVGPFAGMQSPAGPVSAAKAANHIGSRAAVCGVVSEVTQMREIDGRPTFINIGGEHPTQSFTAVIWNDDRPRWSPSPEAQYAGHDICVTGSVRRHEGTPQIIVSSPGQIRVR